MLTTARYLSLFWARLIHSTSTLYLLKIHLNNVLQSAPRSWKLSHSPRFSHYTPLHFSICIKCTAHLIFSHVTMTVMFGEEHRTWKPAWLEYITFAVDGRFMGYNQLFFFRKILQSCKESSYNPTSVTADPNCLLIGSVSSPSFSPKIARIIFWLLYFAILIKKVWLPVVSDWV